MRHQVEVSVPARLSLQRTSGQISVSYDPASVRNVKITVGKKTTIGIKDELRVYPTGESRPLQARIVSEGSISEGGRYIGAELQHTEINRGSEQRARWHSSAEKALCHRTWRQ
jgi:hypothetical protein